MAVRRTVLTAVLILIELTSSKNISFNIIGGEYAKITDFPHSVNLNNMCGASIVNQDILLTAAHCVNKERYLIQKPMVFVGHEHRRQGRPHLVSDFKMHEEYDQNELANDIALLMLAKSLQFGETVRRVALMARPPLEGAEVAGWGRTSNDDVASASDWLKSTKQRLLRREVCIAQICYFPPGSFCTRYTTGSSVKGDSGSALVVRRYIQIGLVSFGIDAIRSIRGFTNVSYFFPWIRKTSKELYCSRETGAPPEVELIPHPIDF